MIHSVRYLFANFPDALFPQMIRYGFVDTPVQSIAKSLILSTDSAASVERKNHMSHFLAQWEWFIQPHFLAARLVSLWEASKKPQNKRIKTTRISVKQQIKQIATIMDNRRDWDAINDISMPLIYIRMHELWEARHQEIKVFLPHRTPGSAKIAKCRAYYEFLTGDVDEDRLTKDQQTMHRIHKRQIQHGGCLNKLLGKMVDKARAEVQNGQLCRITKEAFLVCIPTTNLGEVTICANLTQLPQYALEWAFNRLMEDDIWPRFKKMAELASDFIDEDRFPFQGFTQTNDNSEDETPFPQRIEAIVRKGDDTDCPKDWKPPNMIKTANVDPFLALWSYETSRSSWQVKYLEFLYQPTYEEDKEQNILIPPDLLPSLGDDDLHARHVVIGLKAYVTEYAPDWILVDLLTNPASNLLRHYFADRGVRSILVITPRRRWNDSYRSAEHEVHLTAVFAQQVEEDGPLHAVACHVDCMGYGEGDQVRPAIIQLLPRDTRLIWETVTLSKPPKQGAGKRGGVVALLQGVSLLQAGTLWPMGLTGGDSHAVKRTECAMRVVIRHCRCIMVRRLQPQPEADGMEID